MDRCKYCGDYHKEFAVCDGYIKDLSQADEKVEGREFEIPINYEGDLGDPDWEGCKFIKVIDKSAYTALQQKVADLLDKRLSDNNDYVKAIDDLKTDALKLVEALERSLDNYQATQTLRLENDRGSMVFYNIDAGERLVGGALLEWNKKHGEVEK